MTRIETSKRTGEVIPLGVAYQAVASDIITEYSFGISTNNLDRKDYNSTFFEAHQSIFEWTQVFLHVGWLGSFLNSLPISIVLKLVPDMGGLFQMEEVSEFKQIADQTNRVSQ